MLHITTVGLGERAAIPGRAACEDVRRSQRGWRFVDTGAGRHDDQNNHLESDPSVDDDEHGNDDSRACRDTRAHLGIALFALVDLDAAAAVPDFVEHTDTHGTLICGDLTCGADTDTDTDMDGNDDTVLRRRALAHAISRQDAVGLIADSTPGPLVEGGEHFRAVYPSM